MEGYIAAPVRLHDAARQLQRCVQQQGVDLRVVAARYSGNDFAAVQLKPDSSIAAPDNCLALELVTPKLPFNSEGRRKLCAILQAAFSPFFHSGLQVNQTCGVHVHVDMSGVRQGRISIAELKETICNFICAYPTLALLVSESRRGSRFCKELPSSSRDLQQVQSCRSVEEILRLYNLDRNFALNVQPLARPSPTIEVRFFEATSEPEEVQHMVATVFRVLAGTVPVQSSYSPEVADVLDSVSLPGWEEFGGKAWLKRRMEKVRRRDAQAPPVFVECPGMMLDGWHAPVQRIPASLRDLLEYERDLAPTQWPCWALPRHRHDDCHSRASSSSSPSSSRCSS